MKCATAHNADKPAKSAAQRFRTADERTHVTKGSFSGGPPKYVTIFGGLWRAERNQNTAAASANAAPRASNRTAICCASTSGPDLRRGAGAEGPALDRSDELDAGARSNLEACGRLVRRSPDAIAVRRFGVRRRGVVAGLGRRPVPLCSPECALDELYDHARQDSRG
jgi:hypothetical protein